MNMDEDLRNLYQDLILDHGRKPRNKRRIAEANRHALGSNPLCGDMLALDIVMVNDQIQDIAFEGQGCAISVASASLMTEAVKGKTADAARELFHYVHDLCTGNCAIHDMNDHEDQEDTMMRLNALSGVKDYPVRVKCATLAWHALLAAMENTAKASTE